jgi:hypothetical protein
MFISKRSDPQQSAIRSVEKRREESPERIVRKVLKARRQGSAYLYKNPSPGKLRSFEEVLSNMFLREAKTSECEFEERNVGIGRSKG